MLLPICCISDDNVDKVRIITTEDHCLAIAIHKEARGEPLQGQRAVLDVILNRMRERGMNACAVIKQAYQFPWSNSVKNWKANQVMLDRLEVLESFVEPSLPNTVVYFNNTPFKKIGTFYKKIGKQFFYHEKILQMARNNPKNNLIAGNL